MLINQPQPISYSSVLFISFLFLLASVISYQSGLDLWLADNIYQLEGGNGGHFPLYHNYWLDQVLHEGGRWLVKRMFFITLALFLASWFFDKFKPYRSSFLFIVLATLWATSSVAFIKYITTLPCPSSLQKFGGEREWINFWQLFSSDLAKGKCYPAGHASGGYAWLALVFLAPAGSRKFYLLLLPGITLGLAFGIAQQLRGAHFLSHDLATIACCCFFSGTIYHLMRLSYSRAGMVKTSPSLFGEH